MDNTFFDEGILNDTFIEIQRGRIEEITRDNRNTLVTVSYPGLSREDDRDRDRGRDDNRGENRMNAQIRLVINNRTFIFDEFGNTIRPNELQRGMTINAIVSSAMTRSIPPQTTAREIRVVR